MEKHVIEIVINEDATIETKIKGVKGRACEKIADWIKKLGKVIQHKKTGEFYEKETVQQKIKR